MAAGTGWAPGMIPLERWLQDRGGGNRLAITCTPADEDETVPEGVRVTEVEGAPAGVDDNRLLELEQALASALRQHEETRQEALKREHELAAQFGAEVSAHLAHSIRDGLATLHSVIEAALSEVLSPFIGDTARGAALAELRQLLSRELADMTDPLIHVRAPAHLHGLIADTLEGSGVSCALLEADTIELSFSHHRVRFEELSARWIEGLKDLANER